MKPSPGLLRPACDANGVTHVLGYLETEGFPQTWGLSVLRPGWSQANQEEMASPHSAVCRGSVAPLALFKPLPQAAAP